MIGRWMPTGLGAGIVVVYLGCAYVLIALFAWWRRSRR